MRLEQVAAITSSVRKYMNTPAEIADGLKRIREIGYRAVQISGLPDYDPAEMKRMCDDLDLTICATHEKNMLFVEQPETIVEKMHVLEVTYTGYPYPHTGGFRSMDDVQAVVDALSSAGEVLSAAGIVLVYHNHDLEFLTFGGRTALDIIYSEPDPRNVQGEPHTHWIQAAGGDPVEWCERLSGRLPVLHMKDYGVDPEEGRGRKILPIGAGNLNWRRICDAAKKAGCEWYVVEQDGGTFEGLRDSFEYISENLLD